MNLLFLLFLTIPNENVFVDHVDVVEINHYYSNELSVVFDQAIYWKFNPNIGKYKFIKIDNLERRVDADPRFNVVAWKLIKDGRKKYDEEKRLWQIEQEKLPKEQREEVFKPQEQKDWEAEEDKKPDKKDRIPWKEPWVGSVLVPKYDHKIGKYVSIFHDDDGGFLRKIICNSVIETHTRFDPEAADRAFLEKEKREGFRKPIIKKKAKQNDEGLFFEVLDDDETAFFEGE